MEVTTVGRHLDAHAEIEQLEAQVAALKAQVQALKAKLRKRGEERSGSFCEISSLTPEPGAGWRLRLMCEGVEVGGSDYPIQADADEVDTYNAAMEAAHHWLEHELDIVKTASEYEVLQRPGGGWALRLFCDHIKVGEVVFPFDLNLHCIDAYDKAGCEKAQAAGRNWVQEMNHRHLAAD